MSESTELTTLVHTNKSPKVTVFACGGGGTNMVRAAAERINDLVRIRYIDTGEGNRVPGLDIDIIGGGGSGLDRRHHAETIRQWIVDRKDEELGIGDINIVVFSLAGGSGSVIGPYLVRDIAARRKKLVIALTIASIQSETHTDNTLKALQSLESIATKNDLYLPLSIYNNNLGSSVVDRVLPAKLEHLVHLLTLPTFEVDFRDRLNWINVRKTIRDAHAGLRLMHISSNHQTEENCEVWPADHGTYIYDSVLSLRSQKAVIEDNGLRSRVRFDGQFSTVELVPVLGVIGSPPDVIETFMRMVNDELTAYRTQPKKSINHFGAGTNVEEDVVF